jgi:hypothetical protein
MMQASPNSLSPYLLILFFALFVAIWCLACYLNGVSSGWHLLSKRFRAQSEFLGQTKYARPFIFDACMRYWGDYSGIIRIAVEVDAFYLSVSFLFRIGHPPLCIPWKEIQFGRTKLLWRRYVVLTLGEQERIPIRISERMARKLGILERLPS